MGKSVLAICKIPINSTISEDGIKYAAYTPNLGKKNSKAKQVSFVMQG